MRVASTLACYSVETIVYAGSKALQRNQLTSTKNPFLQNIRRAAGEGRPTEEGWIVAEGPHLVEESLRGKWQIERVIATAEACGRHADLLSRLDAEMVEVPARAFESIASTETSQGILALLRPRVWRWEDIATGQSLVVVLDSVQDPGNVGAMVRSAEAFGATGVVLLRGCARVSNGKVLRATAGSIFRLPFIEGWDPSEFLNRAQGSGLKLYVLDQGGGTSLRQADFSAPLALAVGSEGHGVSPELARDMLGISIPTATVESLNAAIACSIALFEVQTQRRAV